MTEDEWGLVHLPTESLIQTAPSSSSTRWRKMKEWAEKKRRKKQHVVQFTQSSNHGVRELFDGYPARATGNLQVKFSAPSQSSPLKSEHTCSRTKQKEKERKGKEGEQMPERIPEQKNQKNTGMASSQRKDEETRSMRSRKQRSWIRDPHPKQIKSNCPASYLELTRRHNKATSPLSL